MGGYGNKTNRVKEIIDEALLEKCPSVEKVLVVKRTNTRL
jgi:acetyl-CoA synthetase